MPTINIPPLVRFVLYLIAAVALLVVAYAVDKSWAGDAEVRLVTGLAALINLIAAMKTNLSDTSTLMQGTVTYLSGETGTFDATLSEATAADLRADEGDDGLSYEEAGGRPYSGGYGDAPDPRDYGSHIADGDPNR